MLKGLANAFRVPELRKKLLLTCGILLLYRFGAYLPVPGVPFQDMLGAYQAGLSSNGAMAVLNLFSGGALSRMSVFSLGIMPYITAQIILQLMQAVIPGLGELAKEGEAGQRKITQYTRYLTIGLALLNAVGYLFLFGSYGVSFANMGIPVALENVIVVFTLLVGAIIIMWLGEVITQRGIGNGMSLIIFANIMSGLPTSLISSVTTTGNVVLTVITLLVIVAIIPVIVYVERGQRRIPVQYAKRQVGRKMYGGQASTLPMKVNMSGVLPIIFAQTIASLPATIWAFIGTPEEGTVGRSIYNAIDTKSVLYLIVYFLMIIGFSYFYATIQFNPVEISNNLKRNGGFIPGFRPGKPTSDFIAKVLNKVTLFGAIYLGIVAICPLIAGKLLGNSGLAIGGTSVIIVVGVALETVRALESQMMMRQYKGFLE